MESRDVVKLTAQNKLEAICALELLLQKVRNTYELGPIEDYVFITDEGMIQ